MSFVLAVIATIFGTLTGILLYNGLPWLAGGVLPQRLRHELARHYWQQMAVTMRRMLLVVREQAGVDLCASTYDLEHGGGERVKLGGRALNYEDPGDRMAYLNNRPFGIVTELVNTIVDPLTAEVGARHRSRRVKGSEWVDLEHTAIDTSDLPDNRTEACDVHYPLPERPRGVDMEAAVEYISRGSPPESVDATYERIKISMQMLKSPNYMDVMTLAILFLIGMGSVYFVADMLSSGSSGGGQSISVLITPLLGVVL